MRGLFAITILFLATTLAGAATAQNTIVRSVEAGGVVGLIAMTLTTEDRCVTYSADADTKPKPKLGKLVTVNTTRDSKECKGLVVNNILYRAGNKRGVDKFRLFILIEDEYWDYPVVVTVR